MTTSNTMTTLELKLEHWMTEMLDTGRTLTDAHKFTHKVMHAITGATVITEDLAVQHTGSYISLGGYYNMAASPGSVRYLIVQNVDFDVAAVHTAEWVDVQVKDASASDRKVRILPGEMVVLPMIDPMTGVTTVKLLTETSDDIPVRIGIVT